MRLPVFALLITLTACSAPPQASSSSSPPPSSAAPSATSTATPIATATPIPLPSFAQLSAPSRDVVWAIVAGVRLFRSIDRGETWEEHRATRDFIGGNAEIAFLDENAGWLFLPSSPGTQCQFQSVSLAHTRNAGIAWEQLFVARAQVQTNILANAQCKAGVTFLDLQRGFVGAWDPNSPPVIYRTTDGGRSWIASRTLPDPAGFISTPAGGSLRAGRVRSFGATLLVAASGTINGRLMSFAFRSVDGGASWTYNATFPEPGGAVAFVTASRWLQITLPGPSKETIDGGRTWRDFISDYSQAAPIAPEIVFGDPLVGYATVRGGIQRTLDGGAHWTALKTPGT